MKKFMKSLFKVLRSIGKFILAVSILLGIVILNVIISTTFNIPINILEQLEVGIALIIFAIIDIYVIKTIPRNLIMYIILILGIICLILLGGSLTIGAINLII